MKTASGEQGLFNQLLSFKSCRQKPVTLIKPARHLDISRIAKFIIGSNYRDVGYKAEASISRKGGGSMVPYEAFQLAICTNVYLCDSKHK